MADAGIQTLEKGDIYFFYRPRVEEQEPQDLSDIQRFYLVLSAPDRYRLLVIGRKKLPKPEAGGHRQYWGFVEMVRQDAQTIRDELSGAAYGTETRGEQHLPAARPAGEGVYQILRHEDHTHLVFELELPERPGPVQEAFQLEEEASYIISIKNPEKGGPRAAGLSEEKEAHFPRKLRAVFRGRRFANVDPPEFLDHEGAEFVLISASAEIGKELGLKLDAERESLDRDDLFKDLKMDKGRRPVEPLLTGAWK